MSPFIQYSPVFCNDELLDVLRVSGVFIDFKEFIDRPLLEPPGEVLQKLHSAYLRGGATLLEEMILNVTSSPGSDLVHWEPLDWTPRYHNLMWVKGLLP